MASNLSKQYISIFGMMVLRACETGIDNHYVKYPDYSRSPKINKRVAHSTSVTPLNRSKL
ncbi:hypothetical protein HI914_02166 [Erysiphe necator]|nr:hypothetical protein HI914_02166 [Erysiphe necator]